MSEAETDTSATEVDARRREQALQRRRLDISCRGPVTFFFASAVTWLLVGTLLGLLASIKLHTPGFLSSWEWLTFGRVRPAHLNLVIYGWSSMAAIATLLWLQARLARTPLPWPGALIAVGVVWNLAIAGGLIVLLGGHFSSVEWLEFPTATAAVLGVGFLVVMASSITMFARRTTRHIYVSQWYVFGALWWFPILYLLGNLTIHGGGATGVVQATGNWWFAHNVLGIWFTPVGLAAAYYFIPKVIGRPVHSYHLSLLGFWTLAFFYNWAGTHHLIGGPVPVWLTTVGTVASVLMVIPVVTIAINHHMTMVGHFHKLRFSPTLRFIVFGAMTYTAISLQGSLMALRTINENTHFTHYTVAHAHLGMYGFFAMTMFGAAYYIMPRLTGREWSSAPLIAVHFWCTGLGMGLYFVGLTIGGHNQGQMLNDAGVPFLDIVAYTIPFLWSRSFAGSLMAIGHIAFAILFIRMLRDARRSS